ncbi:MAG: APC family permease [Sulfolobaceae archaeon]|jgi:Amino acid transporters|nr:APC family permease [Sulfolobales archaeon]
MSSTHEKEESSTGTRGPARELGLLDIVFLSFGGQSPFLSVLSYGTYAFLLAKGFAPIAIIIGTLIVLVNGLNIYKLSSKIAQPGGYAAYAYFSLTKRLGFQTGWIYMLYAVFYGAAYVVATTLVVKEVFGFNPLIFLTLVFGISSVLLLLGIRPTTKYALFASTFEALAMAVLAVMFVAATGWHFYNPFQTDIPTSNLATAIIFGAGIPTGYGSIAPVSREAKNPKRTIPLAIIIVILMGGGLAAFDTYGIADYLYYKQMNLSSDYTVINLIGHEYGIVTMAFALFAAINDGILATMSYMIASSRTLYGLSYYGFMHQAFKAFKPKVGPVNALLATLAAYAIILYSTVHALGLLDAFVVLGYISMLSGLVAHIITDLALLKISLKRLRKRLFELGIALSGTILTVYIILTSASSVPAYYINVFLLWVLAGFIYVEALDMARQAKEEE